MILLGSTVWAVNSRSYVLARERVTPFIKNAKSLTYNEPKSRSKYHEGKKILPRKIPSARVRSKNLLSI